MKNMTRHTGTFEIIRREKSSLNGNPRYLCRVDGWTCYTAPDSSIGYKVTDFDGKTVIATVGTHYGRPTIDSINLADKESAR